MDRSLQSELQCSRFQQYKNPQLLLLDAMCHEIAIFGNFEVIIYFLHSVSQLHIVLYCYFITSVKGVHASISNGPVRAEWYKLKR